MMRSRTTRWTGLALGCTTLLACACGFTMSHNLLVLNNDVIVMGGGGSSEVMFLGLAGQSITISLVAHKSSMVPYATLIGPNGGQVSAPPASTAVDGENSATVSLNVAGTYRLVVQDNSGQGGTITVRVER